MLLDGNYLLPTVNDSFFPESPPLFFWLATGFSWLMGGASEWSIRLPSALSATELIVLSYYFLRKRFNARLAFLSAVVLATSVLTVHVERHVQVNMLFYLFITGGMLLVMEVLVFASKRTIHAYGAWLAMRWLLTNGPWAFCFHWPWVSLPRCKRARWDTLLALRPVTGACCRCLLAIPWFIYLANTARPSGWIRLSFTCALRVIADRSISSFLAFPGVFLPVLSGCPLVICLLRQKREFARVRYLFLSLSCRTVLSEVSFDATTLCIPAYVSFRRWLAVIWNASI